MIRLRLAIPLVLAVSLAACLGTLPREVTPHRQSQALDPAWLQAPLTLDRAMQIALRNNPRVAAELARLDAVQAERLQAGLLANPMGSLMALRPQGGGRFALDFGLMQSLADLLTRSRRIAVADAAQRRREAETRLALLSLAQDTEAAYYAWLNEQARVQRLQALAALDAARLDLLERETRQGLRRARAALEQQTAVAQRGHELQSAESSLAQARAELAGLLGLSTVQGLITPEAPPPSVLAPLDPARLQALAAQHRLEPLAARAGVDKARAELALQGGAGRTLEPAIGIAARRENDGMRAFGTSLQLALPVFDRGQARRALADAKLAEAGAEAEVLRRQVPLEVERALAVLIHAQLALKEAERHLVRQQDLERLAQRSYRQGVSERDAVWQASEALAMAALDRVDAQAAVWAAQVGLERAIGVSLE